MVHSDQVRRAEGLEPPICQETPWIIGDAARRAIRMKGWQETPIASTKPSAEQFMTPACGTDVDAALVQRLLDFREREPEAVPSGEFARR